MPHVPGMGEEHAEILAHWSPYLQASRLMPDGSIAGVMRFIFTAGLVEKLDFGLYGERWCYEYSRDALAALAEWDGKDTPPGPWLKQKGRYERHNPKLYRLENGLYIRIPESEIDHDSLWGRK